jgi:uncharacterized protein YndB with AHSA1/START domain
MKTTIASTADRELRISKLLNAPRELVFEVWTNPQHIVHWWGPDGFTNTISKMEVKDGGEWNFIMHGPDGRNYDNKIIFVEIIKPELIRYKHVSFPYFNVTVSFEQQENKTLLSMHMLFETKEELQKTIEVFKADEGLKQTISRLSAYVEKLNH